MTDILRVVDLALCRTQGQEIFLTGRNLMTMRKFSTGVLGLIVAAVLSLPAMAEDQPHMQAALDALKQAQQHLEQAEHDKGGHREKALSQVKAAINQVEQGMRYDEKHDHDKGHHDHDHDSH
jgi:hypothetical protein